MMRAERTEVEEMVAKVVIDAVIAEQPELRNAIRAALDKGARPADLHRDFDAMHRRARKSRPYDEKRANVAMTCIWLVDEWERERGLVKPDESIDRVEGD